MSLANSPKIVCWGGDLYMVFISNIACTYTGCGWTHVTKNTRTHQEYIYKHMQFSPYQKPKPLNKCNDTLVFS